MTNRVRWRVSALASAIALLGSLASLDAHALALGRITVQSALGEPLRAEIDIADISAEEAGSLRASVASPEAFKSAGLEYTPAVVGVQVTLQKRADGRSYLRLSSNRAVSEPFVDLVLDASWSSGRVVRDYTMLFDPPSLRPSGIAAAPIAPTAPVLPRPAPMAPSAAGIGTMPYSPPAPAVAAAPAARPAPVARPQPERPVAAPRAPAGGQQLAVKPGDTAGRIAAQNKPASVSLDQMLVAMLRSNPDAFIGGNINRLKSGAVLDMPGADQAGAISPGEASRTIVAQSKDFNDFRRKLAEGAPATQVGSANRQAAGKVEARVEDRAPATTTPDKLTLSKGALQSKAAAEEKIARDRQAKDASSRVAELSKNIGDLNRIAGPSATPAPSPAASAGKAPAVAVPAPGLATAPAVAPAAVPVASAAKAAVAAAPAAASAPVPAPTPVTPSVVATPTSTTVTTVSPTVAPLAAASAPVLAASAASAPATTASAAPVVVAAAPAASVAKKPVAAPPPPPPEPSLIDELTENPFVLPGFAGLLLLLAGLGFYRYKKRNNAVQVDSSFLESRLQPDSFFGASGGQRIDTNEGGATGSSLVYSPSQLDAAGDVDPVAEADVYLAYGRDLQAEEILKEALRTNPTRVAIHSKLMEIYAKRRDAKAFEVIAIEAFNLTRGEGPEWAFISELGRELEPANPMYQPGGTPSGSTPQLAPDSQFDSSNGFGSSTIPQMIAPEPEEAAGPVDFDLDLDFSLGDEPAAAPAPVAAVAPSYQPQPTVAMQVPQDPIFDGLEMDFSTGTVALTPTPASAKPQTLDDGSHALSASGLSFTADTPVPARAAPKPAPAVVDSGMLEFDLGSLSLDLPGATTESPGLPELASESDDPLATKFALAEEFRALGDTDGARSLAEEVASQASGSLKSKAQAFLNALS
ncbi:MAG: fimbrial protein FimV [Polaromonas sp.]|nr:fimbrial protein FimV [Polaromonas sp.]